MLLETTDPVRDWNICRLAETHHHHLRYTELSGGIGLFNARALAKLAAVVVGGGALEGTRIFSKKIIKEMQEDVIGRKVHPGLTNEVTHFDKGGCCHFK